MGDWWKKKRKPKGDGKGWKGYYNNNNFSSWDPMRPMTQGKKTLKIGTMPSRIQ